jgi:micrococcal nuclease
MMQRIFAIILLILFFSTSCNTGSGKRNADKTYNSLNAQNNLLLVIKVVDGDTFWADDGTSKGMKIRLIGVDAPESRKTFKKEVGYFGKEAKTYFTNLLSEKSVRLEYDLNRTDQYGRTLAYVYLEDGTFVNAELVKNGFAMTLTVPPNVKFADQFLKLQAEARENNRGLWNDYLK